MIGGAPVETSDETRRSAGRRLGRPGADLLVPCAVGFLLFGWLLVIALLRWHALAGGYDLAYFTQAAWLVANGKEPFVTVAGLHVLGDHAVFLFYPLALATRVLPAVPALLAVQSAALSLAVVPLWLVCRRVARLGLPTATAVLVAYALFPAMRNVNWQDFHPEVMAVPALLGASYFGITRRWLPYAACVAVALLCREDLAVVVVALGMVLAIERQPRAAAMTVAAAVAWFLFNTQMVLPHFADGRFVQGARLSPYGSSFGDIVAFMLTHPLTVLDDFVSRANALTLLGLFAPLLFLPALAPKWLLPGLPLQLFYLLSNVPAAHTIDAQYTVGILPFAFVATTMAFSRLSLRRRHVVAVALVTASALASARLSIESPLRRPIDWASRDRLDAARLAAVRLVPREASVSASVGMWTLLAERVDLYNFPVPFERTERRLRDPRPLSERRRELDYVVLDTADRAQWPRDLEDARRRLLPGTDLELVFSRRGILVYRRVQALPSGRPHVERGAGEVPIGEDQHHE